MARSAYRRPQHDRPRARGPGSSLRHPHDVSGQAGPRGLVLQTELAEADPNVSRDRRTYAFTVRKDARFSNGKPVAAQAFKHALERILNPAMDADTSSDFTAIVGAQEMLDGKATTLDGAAAKGRTLTLRLTKPVPDFLVKIAGLCAVPPDLPVNPEGAGAPLPSAAPYYAAEFVPGERLVLERNRFYSGNRVHHVDRFVFSLSADPTLAVDDIESGKFDCCVDRATDIAARAAELARRYGVNKPGGQFFVKPGAGLRMFALNTSRAAVQEQPEAPPGDQLRRRPQGADEQLGALRHAHRPVPPAGHAGLSERAHLSPQGPGPEEGSRARKGTPARRQGGALRARTGLPGQPRQRSSSRT